MIKFLSILSFFTLTACVIKQERIIQQAYSEPKKKLVQLVCDENCTDSERARIPLLEKKINDTLGSKCFADFILTPNRPWNYLEGKRPSEVLNVMRQPQILLVSYFYHPIWQLEGYEVAGQAVVHLNRNSIAHQNMSLCTEASLIAHEVAHAKGLNHRGNNHDDFNDLTPPYQVNHAFEDKTENYLNGGCCL